MSETATNYFKRQPPTDSSVPRVIEAQNIHKSFDGKQILNGLSFTLHKSENLVVLGRSGTGKSVLIKCLVGLIPPDEGELCILGQNIMALDKEEDWMEIRRKVGFLFQGGALYDSMSVRENLEFPLKRQPDPMPKGEMKDAIAEVLGHVGLLDAINKMPAELSGGMKKRIALARTLVLKPEIVLYDEPTTGLDAITSREISELILHMRETYGVSSVIITHDMPCARITANRIAILHEGRFGAEGTYDELESSGEEWVRSYFE
jgi:phospholipid/cholesterol/gamma-HCH transport system ATP-binding protein